MEDLRHSLHRNHPSATLPKKNSTVNGFATKTAYDDVFGGPPKFSVPSFPSRITDYGEIFGGFYTPKTSSIPFLDFPAADEDDFAVDVRSSNFDYSEVFGGFNGGDFAVSYEELFTEPKSSESASTDDWIPAGADTLQRIPAVVTRDPLEELREDPFACSEKNQFMPNGASDHGTKQFSVSYHKTSHRTREDAINGTTHIAQLHVVPGYTSFVDACSLSEKTESIKTVPQLSNDSSLHVDFNEGTVEGTHSGKTMLQNRSGISIMKTSGNDLKADQKQFNSENSALEDASANGQHQLHYSSDHLTSDGDRSYRDGMFLTVSEINLRTQPSHVPPPARPPPKLVSRQGHSKGMMSANLTAYPDGHFHKPLTTDQAYTFGGAFETYVVEEAVKDISPPFFDVEVDVSSAAAAASAAAMKAMEQAQVRLKSAKESMERKRGNLQNKKLGSTENIKGKEKREGKIVQEAKKFKEGIVAQEAYEIEKSEMKDFNGEEKRKATREAPVAPDFEKKGRHVKLDKDSLEKKQTKDSRIALDFFKPEESMGEWKAEKQFYELVKNEKFKVAEASGWENNESKLTETPMAYDNKQNDSKATKDALKSDEKEGKLNAFKEANEQEENDKKLKAAREACQRRENEKILREALEALELEENENKLKSAQEALEQEENCKKPKSAQEALERAESEKKVKAAQEALEWEENEKHLKAAEEAREQEEKKKKLKAVQEALVRQENEKKLKAAQEALLRQENEKKLKVAQEALVREENERKQKAAQEALVREENEKKLKAAQEALVREENEKKQKAAQEALMREENEKKLKATQEALVRQENEKKLKAAQEALVREENEKKQRAAQAALVREENEKKLKAAQEALVRQENEDKLKAALVREEHEKKLKAVQEALENEKKLKAAHEALVREEHEKKLKAVQEALVQEENEKKHKVAQETLVREEKEKKLKAAQEVRQREEKEKNLKAATEAHECEKKLKADNEAREQDETKETLIAAQEALGREENKKKLFKTLESLEHKENGNNMEAYNEAFWSADSQNKEAQGAHEYKENDNKTEMEIEALLQDEKEKVLREAKKAIGREENEKKLKPAQVVSEQVKVSKMLKLDLETHEKKESEKNIKDLQVSLECEENKNKFKVAQEVLQWIEKQKRLEAGQRANVLKEKGNILKTPLDVTMCQDTKSKEKNMNETHTTEESDKEERTQREKEHEVDQLRKIEEREREREREKDRIAVERATREARERAFSEARERVAVERMTSESRERAAVERVTAEARQRAMAEARERAEKTSAEAREKSLTEKASMEARLRLERAAVERATAEARERAAEKAMAEKAARDRQKKENEMEGFVGADSSKDGHKQNYAHDQQFQSAGSTSGVFQRYSSSSNHASYSSEKFQGAEGESATRCKARSERNQRTIDRAAKALAEKSMRDVLAQREQAERNRLAETLDADVRRWSNGKEGNLRALLSTLQYILGTESGWQPVPLTDVITAVAVKKAYRKATLCVHPDKLQQRGASIQQKYVCEKVFDLLKEAWNKFNSEER